MHLLVRLLRRERPLRVLRRREASGRRERARGAFHDDALDALSKLCDDQVAPFLSFPDLLSAEELAAECDARLESRWPVTDRLAVLAGVPQQPPAGLAEDVAAHLGIRDGLLEAVAAATSVAEVEAVQWPE